MTQPTSYLYVPGDRPDRFDKALNSGARAVIFDLEDAVAIDRKDLARQEVVTYLSVHRDRDVPAWVRINDEDRGLDDLAAVAAAAALAGVVVPKAGPERLGAIRNAVPQVRLIPLVETAAGIADVREIAAADGVVSIAMGEVDLDAELGFGDDPPAAARWALRMQVVIACAAARCAPPIGPVVRGIADLAMVADLAGRLRQAGFGAMQAIHPSQVAPIDDAFAITPAQRRDAERLLEQASGVGANVVDGRMVDEAVLRRARRTIEAQP